jgi:PEP-CTERM putative exosortase interaction domain
MKKMMICALLGAIVVGTSHAAEVTWGAVGFREFGSTTTLINFASNGGTALYFQLVFTTDAVGSAGAYTYASGFGVNDQVVDSVYYANNGGGILNKVAGNAAWAKALDTDGNSLVNFYLVALFDPTGNGQTTPEYWYVSNIVQANIVNINSLNTALSNFSGNTGTGTATGWIAVPEPTSMALLAMGVAIVGLRRQSHK